VTTNTAFKSPIVFIVGLLFLLSVTACQSTKTAEDITLAFWSAIAENNLELAKKYCSAQSKPLLSSSHHSNFQNTTLSYGKIVIDGNQATVETLIIPADNNQHSFITFLLKEDNDWKVDYQRSRKNLENSQLFADLFKSLDTLSDAVNKQLEQQLPLIEKGIKSFGQAFKQKIDDLENELKKIFPQKEQDPYQKSI
jgi:hypothetical protein